MSDKLRFMPSIIIDTREQLPYEFKGFTTKVSGLKTGDYSLEGLEDKITIERKSLADFVSSVVVQHDRFCRECDRMVTHSTKAIIVEGTMEEILRQQYKSQVHHSSVIGATAKILIDYGIPVIFCGGRIAGEYFTLRLLTKFWKRQEERRVIELNRKSQKIIITDALTSQ
jgi:DNA excision repair protein ERCC-4